MYSQITTYRVYVQAVLCTYIIRYTITPFQLTHKTYSSKLTPFVTKHTYYGE